MKSGSGMMHRILTLLGCKQRMIEQEDQNDVELIHRRQMIWLVEAVQLLLALEIERQAERDNVDTVTGDFVEDMRQKGVEVWDEDIKEKALQ
jgi:hypothetical protein